MLSAHRFLQGTPVVNPPKKTLIMIGENHTSAAGPLLLKCLAHTINPAVFLEIHDKADISRLWTVWKNDEAICHQREELLKDMAFLYEDSHAVDMNWQHRHYINEGMREGIISQNIQETLTTKQHGLLLIGYNHIYSLGMRLKDMFNVIVFLPQDDFLRISPYYKRTRDFALQHGIPNYFYTDFNLHIAYEFILKNTQANDDVNESTYGLGASPNTAGS